MGVEIPHVGAYAVVAEQSEISFSVKHRFGTGTVRGRFNLTGGALVVADPVNRSTVSVSADPSSFESRNTSRDAKVRSVTFLDVARYPSITFNSHAIGNAEDGSWQLHGDLTAHGVVSTATFTLTETRLSGDGDFVDLVAVGSVDRYAHGVTAMKGMAGRHVHLTITLHAERTTT